MAERYNQLKKKKSCRTLKNCDECHRIALVLVEGQSAFDDELYWQSEHGSKAHPSSKPVIEIIEDWITARGVSVDELVQHLQERMDKSLATVE
jgi:hypothetical protein